VGPGYQNLLRDYVKELREAKEIVNEWWQALVAQTLQQAESEFAAAEELRRRWPVGPAAHPAILRVVRKYYLACDELNRQVARSSAQTDAQAIESVATYSLAANGRKAALEPDLPLSPGVLVGESLFTAQTRDLADIVGRLTYWPIGLDEKGRYV
jgi:hypothetical protein